MFLVTSCGCNLGAFLPTLLLFFSSFSRSKAHGESFKEGVSRSQPPTVSVPRSRHPTCVAGVIRLYQPTLAPPSPSPLPQHLYTLCSGYCFTSGYFASYKSSYPVMVQTALVRTYVHEYIYCQLCSIHCTGAPANTHTDTYIRVAELFCATRPTERMPFTVQWVY